MGKEKMKENILFGSSFETSLRILMLLDELNLALDKNQISYIPEVGEIAIHQMYRKCVEEIGDSR